MSVIAAPGRSHTPAPPSAPSCSCSCCCCFRASAERSGRDSERGGGAWWRCRRVSISRRVSIAAVAAVLVGIGWSNRWGGADFAGSMTSLRVVVVGPLTLAIIGVFLVVERVRPAQRRPLFARGYRQDLLYTVLNATLVVPLVTALTLSFSEVVHRSLPWIVLPRIGTVPRWGAIAVIFVAMDGCNWFAHLANHRVRMLWRFHELHHSQEDMSVLTVFRTHPLIHVSYLDRADPGDRAPGQRRAADDPPRHLRRPSSRSRTRTPTWASGRSDGSSSVRTSTGSTTSWTDHRTSTSASP